MHDIIKPRLVLLYSDRLKVTCKTLHFRFHMKFKVYNRTLKRKI